ncbi:MAG: VCBS repeat-containing protein, partial [Chloroflexota bacterium]|nr:VCBS repeat-containing protein [Chloroflexota bacterium]
GDGDIDVLGAANGNNVAYDISWWKNDGSQNFGDKLVIDSTFDKARDVYATDIDGDGDIDVVGASYGDNDINWWENDGSESFTQHAIDTSFSNANSAYAIDVDNDGDIDVLGMARGDDDVTWWENDGSQSFTEHTIDGNFDHAYSIYATDIDNDGDVDVLGSARRDDDVTWWENDGSESFTKNTIQGNFDGAETIYAADIDGDGDVDILGAANEDDDIAWWENTATFSFDPTWSSSDIDTNADGATDVHVADMDGDGDLDIVSASEVDDTIAWYENNGASDPSWSAANIDTNADGARRVFVADMDNDGDMDILSASSNDNTIAWYRNDGASDPSWTAANIDTTALAARSVFAADMDNDGDMDVISASCNDDAIAWYENLGDTDDDGTLDWTAADIDTNADCAFGVFAADIDSDGDMDIASASSIDDTIAWYENDGASDPSWTAANIDTHADGARDIFAADMDGDGDIDLVSASWDDDTIAWYENDGASDPSWTAANIDTNANGANRVFVADMDNDG